MKTLRDSDRLLASRLAAICAQPRVPASFPPEVEAAASDAQIDRAVIDSASA